MRKYGYFLIIILLIMSLSEFVEAQQLPREKVSEFILKARTNDQLYINDTVAYMMSKSPLEAFSGYQDLYSSYDTLSIEGRSISVWMPPGILVDPYFRQNYSALWCLRDNTLYLSEISFPALPFCDSKSTFPDNEQYKLMEKLTGIKFDEKHSPLSSNPLKHYNTIGMMPATWFNDTILIKISRGQRGQGKLKSFYCAAINDTIWYRRNETEMKLDEWRKTPSEELIFKNGKLISKKTTDIY